MADRNGASLLIKELNEASKKEKLPTHLLAQSLIYLLEEVSDTRQNFADIKTITDLATAEREMLKQNNILLAIKRSPRSAAFITAFFIFVNSIMTTAMIMFAGLREHVIVAFLKMFGL